MDYRLRDILLFSAGLGVMIHQTLVSESVSPTLVGASLTMMVGAPAVYHVLNKIETTGNEESKDKSEDDK